MQVEILHKMTVKDLKDNEYLDYFSTYISKVNNQELVEGFIENRDCTITLLESITENKYSYSYAEGKWSIKELLQHIVDTERIFSARALRIARNDKTKLPGFDQDDFNPYSGANGRSKSELINDYIATRNNTISLFNSFTDEMLLRIGHVSGHKLSTRASGFIIIGHENHHLEILKERYL